ncbi:hypothetical protein Tco_0159163 [Tanacetum coccineum]
MVRCSCDLEAVIRTSWTNRNPSRRFYGCPTLQGNSPKRLEKDAKGNTIVMPPVLFDEHIKARFGGNEESKKMRKTIAQAAFKNSYDRRRRPTLWLEMEELDLKWQMAMLSLRINRFEKKTGRKMNYNNKQPARFDRRKVRCYKCLQLGTFCRSGKWKTMDEKADLKNGRSLPSTLNKFDKCSKLQRTKIGPKDLKSTFEKTKVREMHNAVPSSITELTCPTHTIPDIEKPQIIIPYGVNLKQQPVPAVVEFVTSVTVLGWSILMPCASIDNRTKQFNLSYRGRWRTAVKTTTVNESTSRLNQNWLGSLNCTNIVEQGEKLDDFVQFKGRSLSKFGVEKLIRILLALNSAGVYLPGIRLLLVVILAGGKSWPFYESTLPFPGPIIGLNTCLWKVNPVPTKRVNTIHPQSQILVILPSPVLTEKQSSKIQFGESAFLYNFKIQQKDQSYNPTSLSFACFLSQLEPQLGQNDFEEQEGKPEEYCKNKASSCTGPRQEEGHELYEYLHSGQKRGNQQTVYGFASISARLEGILLPKHVNRVVKSFVMELHQAPRSPVSACSRHQGTPLTSHLHAVQKIFKKSNTGWMSIYGQTVNFIGSARIRLLWLLSSTKPSLSSRTKHINRHHFIRDANEKNLIHVLKIYTDDNVADLLTKAFNGPRFEYLVVHIGMSINTAAIVVLLPAAEADSAGSTYDSLAYFSWVIGVSDDGTLVLYNFGVSACTARQMVFSSPWLTAKKESGSPLQTALVCNSNPLIALASPEQTATGKDMSNPLYGCDGLPKTVRVFQFTLDSRSEKLDWFLLHQDWKLLFFDVATSFDSAVHRVHAVSFDAAVLDVASTVSAACIVAAGYIVSAGICDAAGSFVLAVFIYICCLLCFCCYSILLLREDLSRNLELTESKPMVSAGSSSSIPADYVPAGHVLISADRYRIC